MKMEILQVVLVLFLLSFLNVSAQVPPPGAGTPAGGGDKNLRDTDIKMRSVEMERIKREEKSEAEKFAPVNKQIETRFPEIKEDFEDIQILQAAIIKAYTTGRTIDYDMIEVSAMGIIRHAKRLDANLFADTKKGKSNDIASKDKDEEKPKDIKDLIVELDASIGNFVSSKIFQNLRVIEPSVAISARTELLKIQDLSQKLAEEAKKKIK